MPARAKSCAARMGDLVRLPLPGQDPAREGELLADLTREFKPTSLVEQLWVEDIAWCTVRIEHLRAVIAAHHQYCVGNALRRETEVRPFLIEGDEAAEDSRAVQYARMRMKSMAIDGFTPRPGRSLLADRDFAKLLGAISADEQQQMRQLQVMHHEAMEARNRLINQIHRTHKQAMCDAVAVLEAHGWMRSGDSEAFPAITADADGERAEQALIVGRSKA